MAALEQVDVVIVTQAPGLGVRRARRGRAKVVVLSRVG